MLWFLRRYPTEIESDLSRYHPNVDFGDWHTGARDQRGRLKLSSRKLLAYLEHLPDTGAFKMALADRGGDWPEWVQILAGIHRELAMDNAAKYQLPEAQTYLSPKERWERYIEQAEDEQAAEGLIDSLFSDD